MAITSSRREAPPEEEKCFSQVLSGCETTRIMTVPPCLEVLDPRTKKMGQLEGVNQVNQLMASFFVTYL